MQHQPSHRLRLLRIPRGLVVGCALLVAVALSGCGRSGAEKAAPSKPPEVTVEIPRKKEVTPYEDFSGRTESALAVQVRARVSGYVRRTLFKEGSDVGKDDILVEIDPRTYKADLDKATAEANEVKARLARITNDVERSTILRKQNVVTPEAAERLAFEKSEAQASLEAANATRTLAELNLEWCKVTAPFAGRISRRQVDPGNLVRAHDTVLTTIVALDPLQAYFDIDERTLLRLRRDAGGGELKATSVADVTVQVGLADEEGFSLTGTVDFVDNQVDPNTGTLRARAVIANPKRALAPGLFVRLRLPIGGPRPALLVPEGAVGSDQGQKYLYVLDGEDQVEYRRVKTGQLDEGLRVIESGIGPNDRIVVNGLQRIRPGTKVRPTGIQEAKEIARDGTPKNGGPAQANAKR